jgi:hypothetical protein
LVTAASEQRKDYQLDDDGRVLTFPALGVTTSIEFLLGVPGAERDPDANTSPGSLDSPPTA